MPTLRAILDNTTITAAAPKAIKPSPVAQHVSDHVQDPFGATKEGFQKLQQKKLEYDLERENMQRQLAPVQSVIQHVSDMHGIQPGTGTPGMMNGQPGNTDNPDVDEYGNPINMGQTPGQMNQNRPSQAGFKPGVAPGFSEKQVVPGKAGMASPGGPAARNAPRPNAQGNTFNKMAAPPRGNRSMPGAKGPGDKKVANKGKQAQTNSSRQIKVHVTASGISAMPGARNRLETQLGLGSLKCGGIKHSSRSILSGADMSANELRELIEEYLREKFKPKKNGNGNMSPCGGSSAWATDIFPMDNYFVYKYDGKSFRQDYTITQGDLTAKGDPVRVKSAFVKAAIPRAPGFGSAMTPIRPSGVGMMGRPSGGGQRSVLGGGPGSGRRPGGAQYKKLYDKFRKDGFNHEFAHGYAKQGMKPSTVYKSIEVPGNLAYRSGITSPGKYPFKPSSSGYGIKSNIFPGSKKVKAKVKANLFPGVKKVKADVGQTLHEKDTTPGHEVAYNPVIRSKHKGKNLCADCGKMHADSECPKSMKSKGHGTSLGAKKGWSTRGKGHLSKSEKAAHYQTMD